MFKWPLIESPTAAFLNANPAYRMLFHYRRLHHTGLSILVLKKILQKSELDLSATTPVVCSTTCLPIHSLEVYNGVGGSLRVGQGWRQRSERFSLLEAALDWIDLDKYSEEDVRLMSQNLLEEVAKYYTKYACIYRGIPQSAIFKTMWDDLKYVAENPVPEEVIVHQLPPIPPEYILPESA
jgi:hypothetical protein